MFIPITISSLLKKDFAWRTCCVFEVGGVTSLCFIDRENISSCFYPPLIYPDDSLHFLVEMFLALKRAPYHKNRCPDAQVMTPFVLMFLLIFGWEEYPAPKPANGYILYRDINSHFLPQNPVACTTISPLYF
jgi:hypothetical protein